MGCSKYAACHYETPSNKTSSWLWIMRSRGARFYLIVSAWSGDKTQMDPLRKDLPLTDLETAHYQKLMFLEMHLKAMHRNHRQAQGARIESFNDFHQSWETWKEQERANSLNIPIPSPDDPWQAPSDKHWIERMPSSFGRVTIPPSLSDWVGWFSKTNYFSTKAHISPVRLRLLLCHLQNQVIQLRSAMDTAAGRGTHVDSSPFNASTRVQGLLHKWNELAKIHKLNETATPENASNIMLYHLIMLNMIHAPVATMKGRPNRRELAPLSTPTTWEIH
ncbi:hypothetical protein GB937_007903 [Aspergillus fischeri]|nr:hypothetical protein GB937_007903 [Aspergillus fischeri]